MNSAGQQSDHDASYFDKERERLVSDITSSFEGLLSSSNLLNRKLEEVLGVGKEFETISSLWGRFHDLMREQQDASLVGMEDGRDVTGNSTVHGP